MKEIDLRHHLPMWTDWYLSYLAYLASTPRNWIEYSLEPLVQEPGSPLRIVDHSTLIGKEAPSNYPTDGLALWWVIICLDGAPERVHHERHVLKQRNREVLDRLTHDEDRFRLLVTKNAEVLGVEPNAHVLGDWRDGEILGYEQLDAALSLASHVAGICSEMNRNEHLPWNHQFHVRAGVGRSLRDAFKSLTQAKRNQLCFTWHPCDVFSKMTGTKVTTLGLVTG